MPCSKREWLRRESSDRKFSSMTRLPGQIELCSRHRRLEELPACLSIRQNQRFRQAHPLFVHNFSVRPASADYSEDTCSAEDSACVATDANIGNAVPFPRCPDMHLARATTFNALPNHHLLITFC